MRAAEASSIVNGVAVQESQEGGGEGEMGGDKNPGRTIRVGRSESDDPSRTIRIASTRRVGPTTIT